MQARLLCCAAALLLAPASAAAQTAPTPPSSVPPPAKSKEAAPALTAKEAIDLTTTVASGKFNGAMTAIAGSNPSLDIRRQTRLANTGVGAVSTASGLIDIAASGFEVGTEISRGNYADAARKGVAATVNTCANLAIDAGCRVATVTYTGPASVYTSPLCVAAAQIAKTCFEKWTGTTFGDAVVNSSEMAADFARKAYDSFNSDMNAGRAAAADRLARVRAANEDALAERAFQQQQAAAAADQAASSANDALIFNSFIQGLGSSFVQTQPVPLAPAGASGCHSGHDEVAHPGGCHQPQGGAAR